MNNEFEFKGTKGTFEDGHTGWKMHKTPNAYGGTKHSYEIHWSDDGECVAEFVHERADAKAIEKVPELLRTLNRLLSALDEVELRPDTQEIIVPIMADADNLLKECTEI